MIAAGVDVGGPRKGFHVALLDGRAVRRLSPAASVEEVVGVLRAHGPAVVAVDAPREPAEPGETGRACERRFLEARICGLRLTPDRRTLDVRGGEGHLGWIVRGLELYAALDGGPWTVVECFPTASWTVWGGSRTGTRARWSTRILEGLRLDGVPRRLDQDSRDALAAARTAQLCAEGRVRPFGPLVVPVG